MNIFEQFLNDEDFDQLNNMVRWNGMNRIKDETVAHHSFMVAWFSRVLAEEIFYEDTIKLKITEYGLFHDFDEMFTGDVLHPLKYNEFNGVEIRNSIDEFLEYKINKKFSSNSKTDKMFQSVMNKDFPDFVSKIVKVADWLSMYFYIKKERQLGNKGVEKSREYCIKSTIHACDLAIESINNQKDYNSNINVLEQIKQISYE